MKLVTRILFIIAVLSVQNSLAKSITVDSAANKLITDTVKTKPVYDKNIQMAAVRDARTFKLETEQKKDLKQGLLTKNSDYFKPSPLYCSDPQMLHDSVYVREFREAAYRRAGHHSGGRVVLIAAGVLVVFAALYILAYETFGAR
jgi:hypothetical protein